MNIFADLLRPVVSLLALAALCLVITGARVAVACVVCVPYPTTTHADDLLESVVVVLAREDPAKPFLLKVTEVLRGSNGAASTGVFLPSHARRRLNMNPADRIVLVRRGADADWQWLGYATPTFQTFVRDVLAAAGDWRADRGGEMRISYFADRLNDENRDIREQAFLEIGRAPYSRIKQVARTVPLEQIRAMLANWRLIEWHSLYILMLAQSKNEKDRAYVRANFESAARYASVTNLAAWATAFAETQPDVAIERIEDLYFKDKKRTRAELEEILRALSVLAGEDQPFLFRQTAAMRWRISGAYKSLLEHHPEMAGWIARDLTRWQRKVLVARLRELRRNKIALDPSSALAVDIYLGQAARYSALVPVD